MGSESQGTELTLEGQVLAVVFMALWLGGVWMGYWKFKQIFANQGWIGVLPSLISFAVAAFLGPFLAFWFAWRLFLRITRGVSIRSGY
jgi:hypothetical protein